MLVLWLKHSHIGGGDKDTWQALTESAQRKKNFCIEVIS